MEVTGTLISTEKLQQAEPTITGAIRSESMRLSAEDPHSGEIHTLNQLENDLTVNPFVARALEKHFQTVNEAAKDRMNNLGETFSNAWSNVTGSAIGASEFTETTRDHLIADGHGKKERLVTISALSNDYPTEVSSKPTHYSETNEPSVYPLGREMGHDGKGNIFITQAAFETAKRAFLHNPELQINNPQPKESVQISDKEIKLSELPENVRNLHTFLLAPTSKIEKIDDKENPGWVFSGELENDILSTDQRVWVETTVHESSTSERSLGNVDVKVVVNGKPIDLKGDMNADSKIEIGWKGGLGARHDKVTVNEKGIPDIHLCRLKTSSDLIVLIHEASHTKQPVELIKTTDNEEDLSIKTVISRAIEDDAWQSTRNTLKRLGINPDQEKFEEMIAHFTSEYETGYKAAVKPEILRNLPEHPTLEDALKLLLHRSTGQ